MSAQRGRGEGRRRVPKLLLCKSSSVNTNMGGMKPSQMFGTQHLCMIPSPKMEPVCLLLLSLSSLPAPTRRNFTPGRRRSGHNIRENIGLLLLLPPLPLPSLFSLPPQRGELITRPHQSSRHPACLPAWLPVRPSPLAPLAEDRKDGGAEKAGQKKTGALCPLNVNANTCARCAFEGKRWKISGI